MAFRSSRHKFLVWARTRTSLSPTRSYRTHFRVNCALNIKHGANYGSNAAGIGYDSDSPSVVQEPQSKTGSYLDADSGRIDISSPTYMVWGSNTGVGKTLVSAGLVISALSRWNTPRGDLHEPSQQDPKCGSNHAGEVDVTYVKPLQTGFPQDSDARFVCQQAARAIATLPQKPDRTTVFHYTCDSQQDSWHFCLPPTTQSGTTSLVCKSLWAWGGLVSPHIAAAKAGEVPQDSLVLDAVRHSLHPSNQTRTRGSRRWTVIETAGGVASPGPSGTLQADLFRPLRLPAILVGDGRLGGISGTIAAYESLLLRGYDTAAVVLLDGGLKNEEALRNYFGEKVPLDALREDLERLHERRVTRLLHLASHGEHSLWWPFTQHQLVEQEDVTVIDSRAGSRFSVLKMELARSVAYATGRYGHVMFPETVHEPAVKLAEMMLEGVGKGWGERVFYSDNGSTAIEVAIKMALRTFTVRHAQPCHKPLLTPDLLVVSLSGSYHGDTLGAQEAQAPTVYTGPLQQPWYTGRRGIFLDSPTVDCRRGKWRVHVPPTFPSSAAAPCEGYERRDDLFHNSRESEDPLVGVYEEYIDDRLAAGQDSGGGAKAACLIIEPVIHGAGGMVMVDPLFQKVLIDNCRNRGLPIIFDEVFTGYWRLGAQSAAELLDRQPDIACYAKLLTGGVVPLAATLASAEVFDCFQSDSKLSALLHGHSYSAHPVGLTAAITAVQRYRLHAEEGGGASNVRLAEQWDDQLVARCSRHPTLKRVIAIGSIFAAELSSSTSEGYGSVISKDMVKKLRGVNIFVRPLGNIIYLMTSPLTPIATSTSLLNMFLRVLDE